MKEKKIEVNFRLQGIKTEQFAVIEEYFNPKENVNLNTGLQFLLDATNKQIGVALDFEFKHDGPIFLLIKVICQFEIEEASWKLFGNNLENKIVVSKVILSNFTMITLGTTRGILLPRQKEPNFSKFIIPVMDVTKLIPEDAVFELEQP